MTAFLSDTKRIEAQIEIAISRDFLTPLALGRATKPLIGLQTQRFVGILGESC